MNRTDLISEVWKSFPAPISRKNVETLIELTLVRIGNEPAHGGKVRLENFGTFQVKERIARVGRNPRTQEPIDLPASKYVRFNPGKALKQAINL